MQLAANPLIGRSVRSFVSDWCEVQDRWTDNDSAAMNAFPEVRPFEQDVTLKNPADRQTVHLVFPARRRICWLMILQRSLRWVQMLRIRVRVPLVVNKYANVAIKLEFATDSLVSLD